MIKIGSFLILIFTSLASMAVQVEMKLEPAQVGVGDEAVLILSVFDESSFEVSDVKPGELGFFEQLGPPSVVQRSVRNMVSTDKGMDWKTQIRKDYQYPVRALKAGKTQISGFQITVDGKNITSKPIAVNVAKSGQGNVAKGNRRGTISEDPFDAMDEMEQQLFRQLLQQRGQQLQPRYAVPSNPQYKSGPGSANESFFVQLELDKTEVYEGEQITASWFLATRGQMDSIDRVKFPDLRGFWKETIEENPTIQFAEEIVNGIPFKKALMASHALFPLRPGEVVIDEFKVKARVRLPTNSGFGLGQAYEYTRTSPRVTIKVKALPTEGKPSFFSGAVGDFDIAASMDVSTAFINQPFPVKIKFEGHGNAKLIELPKLPWPEGVEVFETKSDSHFYKDGRSDKVFEVILIPRKKGTIEVPAFSFAYFNPSLKKYVTKNSQAFSFQVSEGAATGENLAQNKTKPAAEVAKPVWSLPDPETNLSSSFFQQSRSGLNVWWLLAFVLSGFFFVIRFWRNYKEKPFRGWEEKWREKVKTIEKKGFAEPRQVGADILQLYAFVFHMLFPESEMRDVEASELLSALPPQLRVKYGKDLNEKFIFFQTLAFAPDEIINPLKEPQRISSEAKDTLQVLEAILQSVK